MDWVEIPHNNMQIGDRIVVNCELGDFDCVLYESEIHNGYNIITGCLVNDPESKIEIIDNNRGSIIWSDNKIRLYKLKYTLSFITKLE